MDLFFKGKYDSPSIGKALYIHGLGSSKSSRKYKLIEEAFCVTHLCACAEWNIETDVKLFIANLLKEYSRCKELLIFGDGVGCNYAYQLRDSLVKSGVKIKLILINPLLDAVNLIAQVPFASDLHNSLASIDQVDDCFILQSLYDEVIEQTKVKLGAGVVHLKVDDCHRLFYLSDYIHILKCYVHDSMLFNIPKLYS